jgi:hypothetical protein
MDNLTSGAATPDDDNSLFESVTDQSADTQADALATADSAADSVSKETPAVSRDADQDQKREPSIPPGVLREEKEARRAAERRAAELEARLAWFEQQIAQQQQKQQKPELNIFDDPSQFIQEEAKPLVDPIQKEVQALREYYSQARAVDKYGQDKVVAAYRALDDAAKAGDHDARMFVERIKTQSLDPYGDIVRWHQRQTIVSQVGDDLDAFKRRIVEETLKDPESRKQYADLLRQAVSSGAVVSMRPPVSKTPSLGRVGAIALPEGQADDASDDDLFEKIVSRKRA